MNSNIVEPLIESTIQNLTAIKNVLGESAAGMFVDVAKAQLLATKTLLNGRSSPRLISAEATITGYRDAPEKNLSVKAPADESKKLRKKKRGPYRTRTHANRPVWNRENHDAAILIVMREIGGWMRGPDIHREVYNRQKEFGLKDNVPQQGSRDRLGALQKRGMVRRKGQGLNILWSLVETGNE